MKLVYCFLLLIGAHLMRAYAQDATPPLFEPHTWLSMELITDMPALQADRGDEVMYHPARLRYWNGSDTVELPVEIRARGNARRDPRRCEFPPLKLKFEDEVIEGTLFAQQDELKMVCHCQEDIYVMREYLLYQVYDVLSDYCLKVRPLQVTYRDETDSLPPQTRFAFFLEHQDVAEDRMGGEMLEEVNVMPKDVQEDNLILAALFNLMIGNTDWDIPLEKNIRILQVDGEEAPRIIPYDFDWSAAVDASYAQIGSDFERRVYKGPCVDEMRYRRWVSHILIRRDIIEQLYQDFEYWPSRRDRREALEYLSESFDLLEQNGGLPYFRQRCEDR